MAEFNPSTRTSEDAPSSLGASRGTGPNQSFEALFSGIGDAISAGVQTADTFVQNKIEDDARYGYESINDEMGLSVSTVPNELTQSQEGLQKLATAHMQGNITNEYYYQRLASTLKGLRTRYPGYEKQVDSIVQNVTGVNPANAYRNALMQNIENQQQAMASAAGKFDTWSSTKENSEVLGILYPDFYSNPEKYASDEMKQTVKSNVSQYQGRIRLSEDTTKLRSNDKVVAKQQLGQLFGTIGSGYIVGGSEAAGVDSPNVQSMLTNALADGKVDPQEQEALNGFLAQIRVKAETDMRNRYQTSDWGSNFNSSELNEEVKNGLSQIDSMIEMVNSGNINGAAQVAARNKAITDQATADLYKKFPELAVAGAVRGASEAGADKIVDMLIEQNGGGMSFTNKVLGKDLARGVTTGQTTMTSVVENVVSAQGKAGKEKEQLLSSVLDGAVGVLTAPDATPQVKSNTVQNVYGDNLDATWGVVDDSLGSKGTSQRFRLYSKMFNPKITKEIASLNDPKALATYTAAAVDKFQQIPEFRRAAADLSEAVDYNKYFRAHYDPTSNRIILETNQQGIDNQGPFTRNPTVGDLFSKDSFALKSAIKAKDAFNQGLSAMAPIIEANGTDEVEGIKNLMQSVSADLQKDPKQGFLGWLNEKLDSIVAPDPRKVKGFGADSRLGRAQAERGAAMDAAEAESNFKEVGGTSSEFDEADTLEPLNFTSAELDKASASGGQAAILNLLGKTEGTDRGRGYDETLGYGAYTGGDVDLTRMSLDDVDALQTEMLKHPNNKFNSSALGRYQIIRTTLRSLKDELGLDGSETFTPELQDRLAQALLERRGLSRYKSGEISSKQFLNNLAKEWASLPKSNGRGAYAGQRAATDTSSVLNALQAE